MIPVLNRLDQMPEDEQKTRLWLYQIAYEVVEKNLFEILTIRSSRVFPLRGNQYLLDLQ